MNDLARKVEALVVGGGPAGLAAAEVLSGAGHEVLLAEAMPSLGRKFLMAGKSGLNLTKDESAEAFQARYSRRNSVFREVMEGFGPEEVLAWAKGLGEPVFTGSTGRVFPKAMKASPLLRKWLVRLTEQGVEARTRWRWTSWEDGLWLFETPQGLQRVLPRVAVMALGGGSWARLGSNGVWAKVFQEEGIETVGFLPSNVGFSVNWSPHMEAHFGLPVKGVRLVAGDAESRGEWVISRRGMEGGGIYEVSQAVREGAALVVDLQPDRTVSDLQARLARAGKASLGNRLRKAGLSPVQRALVLEWGRNLALPLAERIKGLPVPLSGLMPLDEAISTAGGVDWGALDRLQLKMRPGVFCAGEMLDWDAPTGGYLLTACLATGFAAGNDASALLHG